MSSRSSAPLTPNPSLKRTPLHGCALSSRYRASAVPPGEDAAQLATPLCVRSVHMRIPAIFEKFGSLSAIVSAMGCASYFPVLGSLGATLGLSFLAQVEGIFINTLLPIFAGIAGPVMVFATLYLFWADDWSTYMFYFALAVMLSASIHDLISPPEKICKTPARTGKPS